MIASLTTCFITCLWPFKTPFDVFLLRLLALANLRILPFGIVPTGDTELRSEGFRITTFTLSALTFDVLLLTSKITFLEHLGLLGGPIRGRQDDLAKLLPRWNQNGQDDILAETMDVMMIKRSETEASSQPEPHGKSQDLSTQKGSKARGITRERGRCRKQQAIKSQRRFYVVETLME